ncbi:hypothetical protein BM221_001968 [Beauveria bassiana]|uniref:Uncharacterized protein n=1 Tax=Beauveria bassiana TaxID=176275 RepID=A0A2N6NX85_BEABA|nr:hypothetical protein BM221_001968 [Beauveria bassiana]
MAVDGRISDKSNASAEFLFSCGDLNRQIDALNKYYKSANVSFQLIDAYWTNDDFLGDESHFTVFKALDSELTLGLHKGNISTLNMFLIDFRSIAFAGSSVSFTEEDDDELYGIVVAINTVPGSPHPV